MAIRLPAIDQHGQVIDVLLSARWDATAARRFFCRALSTLKVKPSEVVTDAAPVYPVVIQELIPSAWHHVERYANKIEADHSQLKHRLRPMRGLRTDRTAQVIIAGHAFMQNLRRGHYELSPDVPPARWVASAFTETRPRDLTCPPPRARRARPIAQRNTALAGGVHLAAPKLLLSAAAISAVSKIPVGVYAGRSGAVTPSAAAPLKQSLAATEGVTPDALTAYE